MSTIVVDAAMREKLVAAGNSAEFRDEAGNLLGYLVRPNGPPVPPPGYVIEGEWPSDEEIERRVRHGKRYTTEQVIEHLRKVRGQQP